MTGTRLSLDTLKRRVQLAKRYATEESAGVQKAPLFKADILLAIPNVLMCPTLEEVQTSLTKAIQIMLKMSEQIPQWEHLIKQQKQQQKVSSIINVTSVNF